MNIIANAEFYGRVIWLWFLDQKLDSKLDNPNVKFFGWRIDGPRPG